MQSVIAKIGSTYQKDQPAKVAPGDTVRVHQKITEGAKERTQVFEGVVIRTKRMGSHTAMFTVRRISSGIGVEKSFMLHAPNTEKVEVLRRSKVRRNYLTFLRQRQGKSARLQEVSADLKKTASSQGKTKKPAKPKTNTSQTKSKDSDAKPTTKTDKPTKAKPAKKSS